LKATFESTKIYGLFTAHFDEEFYRYAEFYHDSRPFERVRLLYAVVGVTKVLENVEISQRNYPKYQDMKRFIEQDFATIHDDAKIISKFSRYFTSRIDIKFIPKTAEGDFQILYASDDRAAITKPGWFQQGGIGYQIQSYTGKLELITKATTDGQIRLFLLGLDVRDPKDNSKRIPYWIDYTKLTVNGKVIFDSITPAWHNKLYRYNMDVKAGEEIKIQVEWLPHRSDTGT